jgi:two-component system chemotaxis sensor kinase CheA/two-component system sensor histidine kinase and response regulator WspE
VSDSRQRLIDRFVALSLQRVDAARAVAFDSDSDDELMRETMGDLHTLKGEAMMLGFASASTIAHQLEDFWQNALDDGTFRSGEASQVLGAALDILILALERPTDAELERSAKALLGVSAAAGETRAARRTDMPSAPPDEPLPSGPDRSRRGAELRAAAQRFTHVNTEQIDQVCDAADRLAVGFANARAALDRLVEADDPQTRRSALRALNEEFGQRQIELEELVMTAWALRLTPVEPVLDELAEHALLLAEEQKKLVDLTTRAQGAQVERSVLDELREPLLHLVRNAIDHGIERVEERGSKPRRGRLSIAAESSGPNVQFSVEDDGRGIDAELLVMRAIDKRVCTAEEAARLTRQERYDLVFLAGFSTRDAVTAISGRGVGLDVVRRKVEALSGSVTMTTEVGAGTRFVLTVPAKLSREPVMVLDIEGLLVGIPSRHVRQVLALDSIELEPVVGGRILRREGVALPVHSLCAALRLPKKQLESLVAIIDVGGRAAALTMPPVQGEHELLRRPVDAGVASFGWIAASATLEDGRLVLLPHVPELLRRTAQVSTTEENRRDLARRRVLVVDDSPVVRDLVTEILLGQGFDVIAAPDGMEALALLERGAPDLVVTDVEMPNLDGFGLLAKIRERSLKLPVIMLTTRGSAEDRRRAATLGADAYLIKSDFQGPSLLEHVNRYIGA